MTYIQNILLSSSRKVDYGQTTVSTAGTAVKLATEAPTKSVFVKALAANTGTVYVGNSDVDSSKCIPLAAGQELHLAINHEAATVYLDASANGQKVHYALVRKDIS